LFTRDEVNGLILMFMRIEANIARIARAAEDEDGEASEE